MRVRVFVLGVVLGVLAVAWSAPTALAGVANAGLPNAPSSDPLAGMRWGNYVAADDDVFPAYWAARGEQRRLFGLIALRPRAHWFGAWDPDSQAQSLARAYIQNVTGGRDDVLAQVAIFRLDPWEAAACRQLPSAAQQASYKTWVDGFASGIGSARVALILQPDLPFASCSPSPRVPLGLISYAARVFDALPHTTVYIDVGAGDWVSVGQAVGLLRAAGVRYARGFALNITHYDSTANEIAFGQKVVRALAAARLPGKRFVINTAQNGRPFTFQQFRGNWNDTPACATIASRRCVTLGIPPTWHVASPRWGLSRRVRSIAAQLVDAYLWIGRPWLVNGSWPFDRSRALQLARTTPF